MVDSQEFCLRWNDFHSSFHVSLEALRGDETFTDVTLSCSGHLFKAHRIILSACSAHFKDILKEVPPQQHPVIVLPTVDEEVMRAILEFIYQGQVNVRQTRLGAFLQVAETFAIQGLADDGTKRSASKTPERPRAPDTGPPAPSSAKRRRLEQQLQQQPSSSPTVSGAGPPPPPPPPPPLLMQPHRVPEKTVNLDLTVKSEPDSMLDELDERHLLLPEEMLEDQRLQDVTALDGGQDAHALMSVGHEDSGGSQANFKRRTRSMVWDYFERVTPIDARCLVCGRMFRQGVSGNTTNLRVHLRSHDVHLRSVTPRGLAPAALATPLCGGSGQRRPTGQMIQIRTEDGTVLDIRQEALGPQETTTAATDPSSWDGKTTEWCGGETSERPTGVSETDAGVADRSLM